VNFRSNDNSDVELNVTPLIDVVFLLLIFFMVSTTFQKETELKLQLPQSSQQQPVQQLDAIQISVSATGEFFVNGQPLADARPATIRRALSKVSHGAKDTPVVIKADARAAHQSVVTAMDAAAQLGMVRMTIATANQ